MDREPVAEVRTPATPLVRTAIAVLVSRFPRIDETSILREINELERQGQPVVLVPLLRDHSKVVHEEAKPWLRRAHYMPLLSPRVVASNVRRMFREPRRYFSLLARLMFSTAVHPLVMFKTLAIFPKAVHLADLLPAMGIEHVHAQFATHPTTVAYVVSALSNVSYSFTVHGPDIFVHRLMLREKIARAKFVRAVSTFNKAFLSGLYSAVAEDKIKVVHAGVDSKFYERPPGECASDIASRNARVLSVAVLNRTKGFNFVVDACARLKRQGIDVELTIVGRGPNAPRIEAAIAHHGMADSIRLAGPQPQHEVARLLRETDIFVLPSVIAHDGHMDGLPIAIIEAMAAGKPVIASAISGIPELVKNGVTGYLVDVTHPERVAEGLRQLIENPELRAEMGEAARQKVRGEFDIRITAERLITLFDKPETQRESSRLLVTSLRWSDLGIVALGIRRVHERRDSIIAEVTMTDGISKRDVIVKRQRDREGQSRPAAVRARDEFRVLNQLRTELPDSPDRTSTNVAYTVPRVLLFDEAHSAVIMECAQGTPLDQLIRKARTRANRSRRLVTPIRRAGTWLRAMQTRTHFESDGRYRLTATVVLALADLELVCAADRRIRKHHDAIIERLKQLEAEVAAQPLPVVGHHGDYWPGNIFIGERRVQVIDFEGFGEGLPLDDAAEFLLQLRVFLAYPLVGSIYPALFNAFLDGFGATDSERRALPLFLVTRALRGLAGGMGRSGTWRDYFHRRALREFILGSIA